MCRAKLFFFTIVNFVLFFDSTKQLHVRSAISAFKGIGKTIKNPQVTNIGNTIKKPIVKTFDITIKNSVGIIRRNKNAIKNLARGFQEQYLKARHNLGSKSIKYLGEEGIKKFKYMAPQASRRGQQLARTEDTKNIQMKSTAWMDTKGFGLLCSRSVEQIRGKEIRSMFNMVSESKTQLPLLFVTGGLNSLTRINLVPDKEEALSGTDLFAKKDDSMDSIKEKNTGDVEKSEDLKKQNIETKIDTKEVAAENKEGIKEVAAENKEGIKEVAAENKEDLVDEKKQEVKEEKQLSIKEICFKNREVDKGLYVKKTLSEIVIKSKEPKKRKVQPVKESLGFLESRLHAVEDTEESAERHVKKVVLSSPEKPLASRRDRRPMKKNPVQNYLDQEEIDETKEAPVKEVEEEDEEPKEYAPTYGR